MLHISTLFEQGDKLSDVDLHRLKSFLDNAGKSLETFRYYNTRSLDVVANHCVTFLGYQAHGNGDCLPIAPEAYGHLDKENDNVWLGICVAENSKGLGYGDQMMKLLTSWGDTHGIPEIKLTVDKINSGAIKLYKKHGFEIIKEDNTKLWMMRKKS